MQERKQDNTPLIDFKKAKAFMLKGAQTYLCSEYKGAYSGDRYGAYHGKSGINRANHLIECLQVIKHDNKLAILTALLAIFGNPNTGFFDISIGRSNALASMIADLFLTGSKTEKFYFNTQTDSIASEIFSSSSLEKAKYNPKAVRTVNVKLGSYTYLDKTIMVRFLLHDILNSPEFIKHKAMIHSLAKKLGSALTISTPLTNLNIFNGLSNMFSEYKESVSTALLKDINPSLPSEIEQHISTFFTLKDAGRVSQINKTSGNGVRSNRPTFERRRNLVV